MRERLDFDLPPFIRVAWAGLAAETVWKPRLELIRRAWTEIEWRAVAEKMRPCAVANLPVADFVSMSPVWARHGLAAMPMEPQPLPAGGGFRLVVGELGNVARFHEAWDTGNHTDMAALLGCPSCCHHAHHETWVEHGFEDTTWDSSVATARGNGQPSIELAGPPEANVLWRWLGIRMIPHLPCRFDCEASVAAGKQMAALGRRHGFRNEMDWLEEIHSWPIEYSALHGIAIIKTPILKISTRTDATAAKHVVRFKGERYPAEGARGCAFPYRQPAHPLLTLSPSFQRGLEQIAAKAPEPATTPETLLESAALEGLLERYGKLWNELNIADICTGDYFTVVELTNGAQGAAINLANVHGPHRIPHHFESYDRLLLASAQSDRLLQNTILSRPGLDLVGQSVKIAVLNALSLDLLAEERLAAKGLKIHDGVVTVAELVRPGDTVAMIGCLGNYTCWELGKLDFLKRVYFSDFEYVDPYKEETESFIRDTFQNPEIVSISDGTRNAAICAAADVVLITAGTLCTNTMDDLLKWSRRAREVIVVGREYAMDPALLFAAGATALTTQRVVEPHIVSFVRRKLAAGDGSFSDALVPCFRQAYVVRAEGSVREQAAAVPEKVAATVAAHRNGKGILAETWETLRREGALEGRRIAQILPGGYFTVAVLDDGSVGAAMSYYSYPTPVVEALRRQLKARLASDPLLFELLRGAEEPLAAQDGTQRELLLNSLETAVLSALSARYFSSGGDGFHFSEEPPFDFFAGVERALVVGFGGYFDTLAGDSRIRELHVADASYPARRREMDEQVEAYRRRFPGKAIRVSAGEDMCEVAQNVDVACITASALCNGTLEDLLQGMPSRVRVIVQGQSGGIHPGAFFARGVAAVATTRKPLELANLARNDAGGDAMRPLLEGGLPWVYATPRNGSAA
jgi:uncharacterized protein (DUF4213/DUF364 family)